MKGWTKARYPRTAKSLQNRSKSTSTVSTLQLPILFSVQSGIGTLLASEWSGCRRSRDQLERLQCMYSHHPSSHLIHLHWAINIDYVTTAKQYDGNMYEYSMRSLKQCQVHQISHSTSTSVDSVGCRQQSRAAKDDKDSTVCIYIYTVIIN